MQIVKVALDGALAKLYDYYSDLDTEVGDYVLVPTPYGPKVAVVKKVVSTSDKACKLVVQKIDVKGYVKRKKLFKEGKL